MTDVSKGEVQHLQAENARLQQRATTRNRMRRASVVGLLILGSGLAVLSVVAIWLRVTVLDTNRYVDTVAPIAAQPAVQKAVADKLDAAINERIDLAPLIREALPDRADALAPALDQGFQTFVRSRLDEFTRSP